MNVIVHDVSRTKIVHPLFESGGNGLAMLKRVLLRCAELGAVKEAGYIQVGGPDSETKQRGRGPGVSTAVMSYLCVCLYQQKRAGSRPYCSPRTEILSPIGLE